MMKFQRLILIFFTAVLLAGCATQSTALPTATSTLLPTATATSKPTSTPTSTSTSTPTLAPTDTPSPTPTFTLVPFPGFSVMFDYYKGWINGNQTHFYFLNAQVPNRVYGTVKDEGTHDLVCDPDPLYPYHMECICSFTDWKHSYMEFTFFVDETHTQQVYEQTHYTEFGNEPEIIPVDCEAEFRIYDGHCYYAYTCYDKQGHYLYSKDNIPYGGHFEGYSAPCPP